MPKTVKTFFLLSLLPVILGCTSHFYATSKKITPLPTYLRTDEQKSGIDVFLSLTKSKRSDYKLLLELTPEQLIEKTNGVYKYSTRYFEELEASNPIMRWEVISGLYEEGEKKRIEFLTKNFNPDSDAIILSYKTSPTTTTIGWNVINKFEGKTRLSSFVGATRCFFPTLDVVTPSLSPSPPSTR